MRPPIEQTPIKTLGLVGDGDDLDLLEELERAFGVRFTDEETTQWFTVGDIHDALIERMSVRSGAGLCATAMAFYRINSVLNAATGVSERRPPSSRLDEIMPASPRWFSGRLSKDMAIEGHFFFSTWKCGVGLPALMIGALAFGLCLFMGFWLAAMMSAVLAAVGILMLSTDKGSYRSMTLGDLARQIASRNFAHFASLGANTRPETLWNALATVIEYETFIEHRRLSTDTLLVAPRKKHGG